MKQIIINKTEEDGKMIVDVKLPERKFAKDPVQEFSNSELQQYLKEQGVVLSEYQLIEQTDKVLSSYSTKGLNPNLEGTWIFEKIEKKEKSLNKKKSQTYRKSKAKKSGD